MKCPFCSFGDTKVLDSRPTEEANSIRRRRQCPECEKRFTTYEQIEMSMPEVAKGDGRRESYSKEKVTTGIKKACQKRPVSAQQIESTVEAIEKSILELNLKEVSSKQIGNLVMDALKDLDAVAYVRFASVYKTFKDVDEFFHDLRDHMDKSLTNRLS